LVGVGHARAGANWISLAAFNQVKSLDEGQPKDNILSPAHLRTRSFAGGRDALCLEGFPLLQPAEIQRQERLQEQCPFGWSGESESAAETQYPRFLKEQLYYASPRESLSLGRPVGALSFPGDSIYCPVCDVGLVCILAHVQTALFFYSAGASASKATNVKVRSSYKGQLF